MSDLPTFVYPKGRNRIVCLQCRRVVESRHTYEFVMCECRAVGVDGGHSSWRTVGAHVDYIRLGDYDRAVHGHDAYTHLVAWKDGTLSGYSAEEYRAMRDAATANQCDLGGTLIYVMSAEASRLT